MSDSSEPLNPNLAKMTVIVNELMNRLDEWIVLEAIPVEKFDPQFFHDPQLEQVRRELRVKMIKLIVMAKRVHGLRDVE